MLNDKALEAAARAICKDSGSIFDRCTPCQQNRFCFRANAAIEAYHAALPDDGLVMKLREHVKDRRRMADSDQPVSPRLETLLIEEIEHIADALEVPRAKSIPKGWRPVPEKPTDAMLIAVARLGTEASVTRNIWKAMLAAAPEPSDA